MHLRCAFAFVVAILVTAGGPSAPSFAAAQGGQAAFSQAALAQDPEPKPPSPKAPPRPPCSAASASLKQGPFGAGPSGPAYRFDDATFAAEPISAITVMSGSWIDSIQVTYGSSTAPRHGGAGGSLNNTLVLAPGEYVVSVIVRHGLFVDGITLVTSSGRQQVLGNGDGPSPTVATPCVAGSKQPRLVAIKGISNVYLEAITFIWSVLNLTPPPKPPSPKPPSRKPPSPRPPSPKPPSPKPPSRKPPSPKPPSPKPPTCGTSTSTSLEQGPFGAEASGSAYRFDDTTFAAEPISAITVMSGSWIDSIQVTYGSNTAPRHGDAGGSLNSTLVLAPGEYVVSVTVWYSQYVDGIKLFTSSGRQQVLGNKDGQSGTIATPCVAGGKQPRLVAIKGISYSYLEAITFVWSVVDLPQPSVVMGPFGPGGDTVFSEGPPAAPGAQLLSGIRVFSGSWVDAIQVAFGGTWGPVHGGMGGIISELVLAADEVVVAATVVSGGFVDGMTLTTSTGRVVTLGSGGVAGRLASPCPVGAYRLEAIHGTAGQYLSQITLVWVMIEGREAAAVAAENKARSAGWQCNFGLESVIRRSPKTTMMTAPQKPQCLTLVGQQGECLQGECRRMLACAAVSGGSGLKPPGQELPGQMFGLTSCSAQQPSFPDYQDPTQWCPRAAGLLMLPSAAPVPIRIAVLNLDICDTGPSNSIADVELALYNDPYGLQSYWGNISFGRAMFSRASSVVRTVRLPCDLFNRTVCDFDNWVNYIDANANALGVPQLPSYPRHRLFLVPVSAGCNHIGFSSGNNVYVRSDMLDVKAPVPENYLNILKHELGHSLGLSHSTRNGEEYGDNSDPMGYCMRCAYNAPHLLQLGWAAPLATLTTTEMPAGVTSGTFQLPPLTVQHQSVIVVVPDWLDETTGGQGTATYGTVVLSYRMRVGQDAGLLEEFDGAVSVHRTPLWDEPALEAVLRQGQAAVLEGARLVVWVVQGAGGAATAGVRVCRYVNLGMESECSLSG